MRASHLVRAGGGLACALLAMPAGAQLAGTATLESQYIYRGLPLDEQEPDLRLQIGYDHPSGVYGGASGIAGLTRASGVQALGYTLYFGYVRRSAAGLTWDAGVTLSEFTTFISAHDANSDTRSYRYRAAYREGYVGLSGSGWTGRVYLSPDYLKQGGATYLDLTKTFDLSSRLHGYGHAGLLTPFGGAARLNAGHERVDVGAGLATDVQRARVRIGWTHTAPAPYYPTGPRQRADQLVVGISRFF